MCHVCGASIVCEISSTRRAPCCRSREHIDWSSSPSRDHDKVGVTGGKLWIVTARMHVFIYLALLRLPPCGRLFIQSALRSSGVAVSISFQSIADQSQAKPKTNSLDTHAAAAEFSVWLEKYYTQPPGGETRFKKLYIHISVHISLCLIFKSISCHVTVPISNCLFFLNKYNFFLLT